MSSNNHAKLSVSMYSFTKEIYSNHWTLEEAIAKVKETGATGVEIVAQQHIKGYPFPSGEYIRNFRNLLDKYELEPACYDAYRDIDSLTHRLMTEEELMLFFENDLILAHKLGFPAMRMWFFGAKEDRERQAKLAEKYKVAIADEIHAPADLSSKLWRDIIKFVRDTDSEYIRLCPDMSTWSNKLSDSQIEWLVKDGCPPAAIEAIKEAYSNGNPLKDNSIKEKVHSLGAPDQIDDVLDLMWRRCGIRQNPESLRELIPLSAHMHGKFWKINDVGDEPVIPYESLMKIVRESGYTGFISSEFEGYDAADGYTGFKEVCAHQNMMKRYLGI